MAAGRMVGVSVGIMIGLIICLVLFRYMNRDSRVKTQYDEMQEITRGRAYKYAFWAMVICEAVLGILALGEVRIPMEPMVIHFSVLLIGIIVQCSYCIFKDAYIGINTNSRRFIIVMIVAGLINLLSCAGAIRSHEMVIDGMISTPAINLLCGLMCLMVCVEIWIKNLMDKRESED